MKKSYWILIAVTVIALDQLTKYLAIIWLSPYQPIEILPVFNFTLAYNTGAAFSFLSSAGSYHRWLLASFSILMSGLIIYWINTTEDSRQRFALSLILGGALGNLIDRALYGQVTDFIQLHYQQYYWPIFNVADSAICIGAVYLILLLLLEKKG